MVYIDNVDLPYKESFLGNYVGEGGGTVGNFWPPCGNSPKGTY